MDVDDDDENKVVAKKNNRCNVIYRSLWLDGSVQCHRTPNLAHNHANRIGWAAALRRHL